MAMITKNKKYKRKFILNSCRLLLSHHLFVGLIFATICKIIIILFFYQHIVKYENGSSCLVSDYAWGPLVSSMFEGKYEVIAQTGLSDIYDLNYTSLRPPIYAILLYLAILFTKCSTFTLVFIHSVITSLVAYIGYKIVKVYSNSQTLGILCLCLLFIFPMNFLKSGSIDEAPLMLLFLLIAIYYLNLYLRNVDSTKYLIFSGIFMGLSTMTRYQTLPIAFGLIVYLLQRRPILHNYKKVGLFVFIYISVLSPWIIRNYFIYGKPVLFSGGNGRILLMTQSEEFIRSFPYVSPDDIERNFFREYHKSHEYLSSLDTSSLDDEFKRLALAEIKNSPMKICRSLVSKLKTFVPYRYYPVMHSVPRDIVYVSWYAGALFFFLFSIIRSRNFSHMKWILVISILGWILPGLTHFILSRHLYTPIVLMIIFSFVAHADKHSLFKKSD